MEHTPPAGSPLSAVDGHARYVPDEPTPDVTRDLHESRYAWIAENLVPGAATVLDLGCGSGYGAYHLAGSAARVVGVDVSAAAIAHARDRYRAPNLAFVVVSPDWPLGDRLGADRFDLVVSAEVLEHVRNPFAHVTDMAAVLSPDGVAVVCTPNRWLRYERDRGGLFDRSHVMEFTPEALFSLLAVAFASVDLWFQCHPAADPPPAAPIGPTRPGLVRGVARGARRAVGVFVAEVVRATRRSRPPAPAPPSTAGPISPLRQAAEHRSEFVRAGRDGGPVPPGAVGLVAICRRPRNDPA